MGFRHFQLSKKAERPRFEVAAVISLVLSLSVSSTALAGPFEDGLAAYSRGDYAGAMALWRPLADQGDAKAQNNLGGMYEKGVGAPQDFALSAAWYRKAAVQGLPSAQYNLALQLEKGLGAPRDYAEAAAWYRKAADRNLVGAQHKLGDFYANGLGAPKDMAEAVRWYRLAAGQGDPEAQWYLGLACETGQGAARDYGEAYKWYGLAAAPVALTAQAKAVILQRQRAVAAKLSPEQLAQARRAVSDWALHSR